MKRNRIFLAFMIIALLATVACASFLKTNYRILYVSKATYYTGMQAVADLEGQGLISADQRAEINAVAKIYKEAHNIYEDALEVYVKTDTAANKDKVKVALATAVAKWADLAKLINAIKPGTVPNALLD